MFYFKEEEEKEEDGKDPEEKEEDEGMVTNWPSDAVSTTLPNIQL